MSVPNNMAELHAGTSHSEATAHLGSTLITLYTCTYFHLVTTRQQNVITAETQHAIQQINDSLICTPRHDTNANANNHCE